MEEKVEEEEKVVEKKKKKRREQKTSSSDMLSSRRIQTGDIIKITLDCCSGSRQLSFSLNGENLGVAFGPKGSGAAVELSDQENLGDKLSEELYPAVSLLSKDDHISFESGGLIESHTMSLPWLVDILRTCSGLAARLASTMVAGEPVDTKEAEMEPWLQSPLSPLDLRKRKRKLFWKMWTIFRKDTRASFYPCRGRLHVWKPIVRILQFRFVVHSLEDHPQRQRIPRQIRRRHLHD